MGLTVLMTCPECGSAVHVIPKVENHCCECPICKHQFAVAFQEEHERSQVHQCPLCHRKDFYSQRDFNRKIGVLLYAIPTLICIFVGLLEGILGYFLFWLLDLFLYKNLPQIAICYKCQSIFRGAENINEIPPFHHEMNDRIIYSDHDFKGKPLNPH